MYPDELNYVKNIGPLPMFWGKDAQAMETIEAEGINDYYLLAQEKIALPPEVNKAQEYVYRPTLFRITKTIMGRAVLLPDPAETDLYAPTTASAVYTMPPMPWDMVRKMDEFFRAVHKKYNTEAILVLTYNPAFLTSENPSAGWNCVAPKQTNTPGSCDYEPNSVLERKGEDNLILGTIHSHPEMSAFFSGTDHKDQDDWDGVHITQAWKGNGPTEYHIAMILGGKEWTLQPEQVFGEPPLPNYDSSQVDVWIESVEKKSYTTMYGNIGNTLGTSSGSRLPTSQHYGVPLANTSFTPATKVRVIKLPADAPDPRDVYIVAEYPKEIMESKPGSIKCRMCDAPLLTQSLQARRCMGCSGFILLDDETIQDLAYYRSVNNYRYFLGIDLEKNPSPIVIWHVDGTFSNDQRPAEAGALPKE